MADWGTPSAFDHRPSVVSGLMDLLRAFRGEEFLVFLLLKYGRKKKEVFFFFQLFI